MNHTWNIDSLDTETHSLLEGRRTAVAHVASLLLTRMEGFERLRVTGASVHAAASTAVWTPEGTALSPLLGSGATLAADALKQREGNTSSRSNGVHAGLDVTTTTCMFAKAL